MGKFLKTLFFLAVLLTAETVFLCISIVFIVLFKGAYGGIQKRSLQIEFTSVIYNDNNKSIPIIIKN